jgi:hypothetical protein
MKIISPEFDNEDRIPKKYTCDGDDVSPPLNFNDIPKGTKSLVLIMDDPDSPNGTFTHWLIWNISPDKRGFEEDYLVVEEAEGTNDFGNVGYGGPCPKSGTHRYYFKLYALNATLDLPATTSKSELEVEMDKHVIDEVELVGLYSR